MAAKPEISTYVLMDLEATGLPGIGATPRVVEMSFVAVQRKWLDQTKRSVPRILDKLTLCVNPSGKPMTSGAALITGLYNDALETLAVVDDDTIRMLQLFLSRLPQPVCLLAHNGNRFDFPMLKMEIELVEQTLPSQLLCADTLVALRFIDSVGVEGMTNSNRTRENSNGRSVPIHPQCKDGEITPQKSSDEEDLPDTSGSTFANPPPAPRKKRSFAESRGLGSNKSAKRRLLQEDGSGNNTRGLQGKAYDRNGLTVGAFSLGTTASSPPPSPLSNRSVTRRQLAFGDNGSGEGNSKASLASHQSAGYPREGKSTADNQSEEDVGLLPFPDDFSDDEENQKDLQNKESVVEKAEIAGPSCLNSAKTTLSTGTTSSTESFPDEERIYAVDELLESSAANKTDKAEAGIQEQVCDCLNSAKTTLSAGTYSSAELFTESFPDEELICVVDELLDSSAADKADEAEARIQEQVCENEEQNARHGTPATETYNGQQTPTKGLLKEAKTSASTNLSETNSAEKLAASSMGGACVISQRSDICQSSSSAPSSSTPTPSSSTPHSVSKRVSYKLRDIYKRLFGEFPGVSHTSEDDCISLLRIVQAYGRRFDEWADANAVLFSQIKKLY